MYDGTKEAFVDAIKKVTQACYDTQELFDDINEYIEEDWFIEEDMDHEKANEAHDIAYQSMQAMVDLKWRAAYMQEILSDVLKIDMKDPRWVMKGDA